MRHFAQMAIVALTAATLTATAIEWAWPHHSLVFYREGRLENVLIAPWQGQFMVAGPDNADEGLTGARQ